MSDPQLKTEIDAEPHEGLQAHTNSPPDDEQDGFLVGHTGSHEEEMEAGALANAPFVNKVWLIVNNPANHRFIRWMPGGKSILIVDREGFEKQLLPYYFKHKRFTSFVRQLNMYGWHKVQDLSAGTMQSSEEHWQFANPNFVEGHPELLKEIVRNKGHRPANSTQNPSTATGPTAPGSKDDDSGKNDSKSLKAILAELEQIRTRQEAINEDLSRMRKDNEQLWSEYYQTRERHDKHSQVLGRILRFFASMYGNQVKLLDPNDPMNELIMQGTSSPNQPFMNLLPAGQQQRPRFEPNMEDFRELQQLEHQIQETNTPSGSVNTASPTSSGYSGFSTQGSPRDFQNQQQTTPMPAARYPAPNNTNNVSYNMNNSAVSSDRRLSNLPYWPDLESNANNQLIRAMPNRTRNAKMMNGMQSPQAIQSLQSLQGSQNVQNPQNVPNQNLDQSLNLNQQYPQVQELSRGAMADPAQLFPELGGLDAPTTEPLTSQELEQISRDVTSNGMSLQNIQDWLSKQNLDGDDQFNVDDFLNEDAATPTPDSKARKSSVVDEPESKRVRVS